MRLKSRPPVSSEWRCFFCLHVRTATIGLGVWHVALQLLALSMLCMILRERQIQNQENRKFLEMNEINFDRQNNLDHYEDGTAIEGLPTPLSKIEPPLPTGQTFQYQRDHQLYYPDLDMGAIVTMCTLSITLLLIYGAVKGKPTHLLPFFCLQLFDFAISSLTATGYICYMRSMHRLVAESWNLPFRNFLLQLSPQCLSLVILLCFLASMMVKAYFITIVWKCYKYLTLRQQTLRSSIHYIVPGDILMDPGLTNTHEPVDYNGSLPDYESACKLAPPPSYSAAVSGRHANTLVNIPGATYVTTPIPTAQQIPVTTNTNAQTQVHQTPVSNTPTTVFLAASESAKDSVKDDDATNEIKIPTEGVAEVNVITIGSQIVSSTDNNTPSTEQSTTPAVAPVEESK